MSNFFLNDIKKMQTNYVLPTSVLNVISVLENTFKSSGPSLSKEYIKDKDKDKMKKNKKNIEDKSDVSWEKMEEDWKTQQKMHSSLKPKNTVLPHTGFIGETDNIRIALNKISDKNYDIQKEIIFTHLLYFIDDKIEMEKLALFIFDTVSSNKFYNEIYADLYKEIVKKYPIFVDILNSIVIDFYSTFDTIRFIDASVDYDGFCECVKENDKRRSVASFFMMLCNLKVIPKKIMLPMIHHFQTILLDKIDKENNTSYVEEVSELLFLFISIGHKKNIFTKKQCWIEEIIPNVYVISKMKTAEHPSLSSRTVFKHLDLIDILKK